MNNILKQPYNNTEYANFAVYANNTQRRIEDFNGDKYALLPTEILVDGIITDIFQTSEYIAEQEEKEQERINSLTMTALDFIQVIIKAGATYDQIKAYLDSNAALEIHLKCCKDVYCGVIMQLCPLSIGEMILTEDMAIEAFKKKNNPDYQLTNGE